MFVKVRFEHCTVCARKVWLSLAVETLFIVNCRVHNSLRPLYYTATLVNVGIFKAWKAEIYHSNVNSVVLLYYRIFRCQVYLICHLYHKTIFNSNAIKHLKKCIWTYERYGIKLLQKKRIYSMLSVNVESTICGLKRILFNIHKHI